MVSASTPSASMIATAAVRICSRVSAGRRPVAGRGRSAGLVSVVGHHFPSETRSRLLHRRSTRNVYTVAQLGRRGQRTTWPGRSARVRTRTAKELHDSGSEEAVHGYPAHRRQPDDTTVRRARARCAASRIWWATATATTATTRTTATSAPSGSSGLPRRAAHRARRAVARRPRRARRRSRAPP